MNRLLTIGYGAVCYVVFLAAFLYAIGFVGNFVVPRSIDHGVAATIGGSGRRQRAAARRLRSPAQRDGPAGLQTVVDAVRAATPLSAARTSCLSSLALFLLYWQWRTMPAVIWDVTWQPGRVGLWVLFGLGWATVLVGDVHDQPLRPVRTAAGVSGLARKALHAIWNFARRCCTGWCAIR